MCTIVPWQLGTSNHINCRNVEIFKNKKIKNFKEIDFFVKEFFSKKTFGIFK
jgi:hypothetical protein